MMFIIYSINGGRRTLANVHESNSTDLEKRVHCKDNDRNGDEQPLILAVCTPLMARVHTHIQQTKELVFIDSSASFEDFNNPM